MPAVASDWVVDAASDIKTFKTLPYRRVVRIRLQSGASTYPSGGVGVPIPLGPRLGIKGSIGYIDTVHDIALTTGQSSHKHWKYNPSLRAFQAYWRNPTVSLTTDFILAEVGSGSAIAGSVLYIEVHGL